MAAHPNHAALPGVKIIEPHVFRDDRGYFVETWSHSRFDSLGLNVTFVQDNFSRSVRGVLRGLHYQVERPQGKLIWAVRGEVFDVAVDLRRHSATFGKWTCVTLSEHNHRQVYLPPGLAHGFCVLSDLADISYKCTEPYSPECERTLLWSDPQIGIEWPLAQPILSEKDKRGLPLGAAPTFE
jgi:dTDP-4-dehydrorhamnose 3,5-epimerase